jgi:pyruvate carboxylase
VTRNAGPACPPEAGTEPNKIPVKTSSCAQRAPRRAGTAQPLLLSIIRHPAFIEGEFSTHFIEQHMDELVSKFKEKDSEDEVLKIAKYVADISALGPQSWM